MIAMSLPPIRLSAKLGRSSEVSLGIIFSKTDGIAELNYRDRTLSVRVGRVEVGWRLVRRGEVHEDVRP